MRSLLEQNIHDNIFKLVLKTTKDLKNKYL